MIERSCIAAASGRANLFTEVACTICGSRDYTVVKPARFEMAPTANDLRGLYSASSDHILVDQLVRCRSCQLVYVNPRAQELALVDAYESAVDPAFVSQNAERIATFRRNLKWICDKMGVIPSPRLRLLDVGCAGGACLKAASDLGFSVIGVEPSKWLAEYARNLYGLDVRQGVLSTAMFPDDSFDIVCLWDVMEHLSHPHEVLVTVEKCLKKGGLLVVNFPDIGSWVARLLGWRWPFYLSVHISYYTRATMKLQLEKASFQSVHMRPHWQSLQLAYVLQRMSQYSRVSSVLGALVRRLGVGSMPVSYIMGQTLVIARRGE